MRSEERYLVCSRIRSAEMDASWASALLQSARHAAADKAAAESLNMLSIVARFTTWGRSRSALGELRSPATGDKIAGPTCPTWARDACVPVRLRASLSGQRHECASLRRAI